MRAQRKQIAVLHFQGDAEHCIPCVGRPAVGDEVAFVRGLFVAVPVSGHTARFEQVGQELVAGRVTAVDGVGRCKLREHDFVLLRPGSDAGVLVRLGGQFTSPIYRKKRQNEN